MPARSRRRLGRTTMLVVLPVLLLLAQLRYLKQAMTLSSESLTTEKLFLSSSWMLDHRHIRSTNSTVSESSGSSFTTVSTEDESSGSVSVEKTPSLEQITSFGSSGVSLDDRIQNLPTWARDYIEWHVTMRLTYADNELLYNTSAPNLLVRSCTLKCGGLHDRLGKLPWDLWLAHTTGRVLLMDWCQPAPLESFLQPHRLNWTLPTALYEKLHPPNGSTETTKAACLRSVPKEFQPLFGSQQRERRGASAFWDKDFASSINEAVVGSTRHVKVLHHSILGKESEWPQRITNYSSRVSNANSSYSYAALDWTPHFGTLFDVFFRPTPALKVVLEQVQRDLSLIPGHYSAVHVRARHPKAMDGNNVRAKVALPGGVDRNGLDWNDATSQQYAIETAVQAVTCAQRLQLNMTSSASVVSTRSFTHGHQPSDTTTVEPTYFFSDSEDLVRFMTMELYGTTFVERNTSLFGTSPTSYNSTQTIHMAARAITRQMRLVGRDLSSEETLHIDRQSGHPPSAYYGSFVDLFLAAQARCVTLGVGNYAILAVKISDTPCRQKYKEETWGEEEALYQHIERCPLVSGSTELRTKL